MSWPENVWTTRALLLVVVAAQLTFAWWYLGAWYWLPKASKRRLIGWAFLLVSAIVIPLEVYPEVARGQHTDKVSQAFLFLQAIAFIAIVVYTIWRENSARSNG